MKHLFCLALAITTAFSLQLQAAEPLSAPQRKELLEKLQVLHAQYPSFEANFTEQRTSQLLKKPLTTTGRVAFQSPNKLRREVTGANPSLIVCNGREIWIYYPNFNEAELCPLGKHGMTEKALDALTAGLNFASLEEIYRVEITPLESGGYRMVLIPKGVDLKRMVAQLTVTLDKNLDVRCTDLILPKGDQITTSYTAQKRDPISESTFEFTPPAGANITRPLGK